MQAIHILLNQYILAIILNRITSLRRGFHNGSTSVPFPVKLSNGDIVDATISVKLSDGDIVGATSVKLQN